jgi:ABC-type uncharacterized transport system auxiliary subunit
MLGKEAIMMKGVTIRLIAIATMAGIGLCGTAGMVSATLPGGIYHVQNVREGPSDTQLQIAVSQAMQTNPLTASSQIVVHVTKGEVTLEGAAVSPLARREATRLAETVLGVTSIRNRLDVAESQATVAAPVQQ